ncbi:MAG TPA: hydantoinase/oxoprolinase family protein, partial [Pseudolabrys sp.]
PASGDVTREAIQAAFEISYRASFSRLLAGLPIRIAAMRVAAIGRRPSFDFSIFAPPAAASPDAACRPSRAVWFDGGVRDTQIWSRLDLPAGTIIEGPAILEQPDATTVIEPGFTGRLDDLGNLIVERQ